MAISRLSMKAGKPGKASGHAAYIAREGRYEQWLDRGEKLEACDAGNMPAWARHDAQVFWQASDDFERKNGTTYREMEISLPRELSPEQREALTRQWVEQEIGDRHAYQWAIHVPTAADGKEQPHVHLMFSEQRADRIELDPKQYFGRYRDEYGGDKKGFGNRHEELEKNERPAARAADLKVLRARWQDACNQALERAGSAAQIDMRSYKDRGMRRTPEAKQLPSQWRGQGRDNIIEFRKARAESVQARADLAKIVPSVASEVRRAEQESGRRVSRLEQMPIEKLREWVEQSRPQPLRDQVAARPEVAAATQRHIEAAQALDALRTQAAAEHHKSGRAAEVAASYRAENTWRARLHDTGVQSVRKLGQADQEQRDAAERLDQLTPKIEAGEQAEAAARAARRDVTNQARAELAPKVREQQHRHAAGAAALERREQAVAQQPQRQEPPQPRGQERQGR